MHSVSYEELFSDNGINILNKNLGLELKQEDKKIILDAVKPGSRIELEGHSLGMGIEQYAYKKNFNELKDFFEDDYLLL